MIVHAKRFTIGIAVSALFFAASWLAGGLYPEMGDCWGCRAPLGAMALMGLGLTATMVYGIGHVVLEMLTDGRR